MKISLKYISDADKEVLVDFKHTKHYETIVRIIGENIKANRMVAIDSSSMEELNRFKGRIEAYKIMLDLFSITEKDIQNAKKDGAGS